MARDASYQVQVVAAAQNDCGAAMGLFYNPEHWLFAELKGGQLRVFGAKQTLASRAWKAGTAHLKIVNRHNRVEFLASENGRDWQSLIADFDASGFNNDALHGFQCLRPALAASGAGDARFADFSYCALSKDSVATWLFASLRRVPSCGAARGAAQVDTRRPFRLSLGQEGSQT